MAGKVFISYRRDDSAGHAGRVRDRLVREFGEDLLFMDVDAIPLGTNFTKVLDEAVGTCDVLLAVIGPSWAHIKDGQGLRRLDSPNDFVRIEIAAALRRDIPVIPVLLDGTPVPNASTLPDDIKELSLRNGLNIHHGSFHADMDRLVRFLKARHARGAENVNSRVRNKRRLSTLGIYLIMVSYLGLSTVVIGTIMIGLGIIPLLERIEFCAIFIINLFIVTGALGVYLRRQM